MTRLPSRCSNSHVPLLLYVDGPGAAGWLPALAGADNYAADALLGKLIAGATPRLQTRLQGCHSISLEANGRAIQTVGGSEVNSSIGGGY